MADFLSQEEKEFVAFLKKVGILRKIDQGKTWCKNGGVKCCCGDGHKDMVIFHKEKIHPLTNLQTIVGGPLAYSLKFLGKITDGFFTPADIKAIREWHTLEIMGYMDLKKTKTLFNCFHFPCGAAVEKAGISIKEVFTEYIPEVVKYFDALCGERPSYFSDEKIFYKFHIKKINAKKEAEQSTYLVDLYALRDNMEAIIWWH